MIPLPHDATPQDVEQWCSRGVVMFRNGESWIPVWYRGQISRPNVEGETFDHRPVSRHMHDVAVHWPLCGSVNLPDLHYAVHAARQTQRQYRRTWHVGGLDVVVPRSWDVAKKAGRRHNTMGTPQQSLAQACFCPEYPDLSTAEAWLSSGDKVSVALNPRLIIAGDKTGKRMFYYNGLLAATASDGVLHAVGNPVAVRRITKMLEGRYYGPSGF